MIDRVDLEPGLLSSGPGCGPNDRTGIQHAPLAVLALSAFVYVTAETLPVWLLLTSCAAVAALSTIPLTAITMRIPRHRPLVQDHEIPHPAVIMHERTVHLYKIT